MLILRLAGKCLLFVAFAAAAFDGIRAIASPGRGIILTSLSSDIEALFPAGQENIQRFFLAHAPVFVWHRLLEPMMLLPLSLLLGALGTLLFLTGYRKPPPEITGE